MRNSSQQIRTIDRLLILTNIETGSILSRNISYTKRCVKSRTKKDCKLHDREYIRHLPTLFPNRFDSWIRAVDTYSGNDLLYLNPSGVLPEAAVITKGVRRENPFRERRVFDMTSFTGQSEVETKLEEEMDEGEGLDERHLEETEG